MTNRHSNIISFSKHVDRTKAIHRRQFQAWAEGGTSAATQKTLENSEIYDVGAFEEVITLDTVGAVVIDSSNRLAAGVSSGGVALKCPGRVGQAAMFGTGCWADETVAISTSGVGEQLIRSMLAQRCAQRLNVDESESKSDPLWSIRSLHESISTNFLENHHVTSNKAMAPSAGILTIVRERSTGSAHVLWAHTTPSFCIAYAVDDKSPSFSFSKLPTGQSIVVQSANS